MILTLLYIAFISKANADGPYHIPVYTGTPLMIAAGVVTQQNLNRALSQNSNSRQTMQREAEGPQFLTINLKPAGVPKKLAQSQPIENRDQAEKVYQEMLDRHPDLMKKLGVRSDDLACGLATFLAGSYMAYNEIDFPDEYFKPLYEQVRVAVAANRKFADASLEDRRDLYERTAIIGTFLALNRLSLKQSPNPKKSKDLKIAAQNYLKKFLNIDAKRLQLTASGMVVKK